MECGGCLKQPPYSKSGVWRSLSGVWRLLETTSTLHSTPHDLGHKWSVEVTQIETKNEWSVEVFECFLRFGATVCRVGRIPYLVTTLVFLINVLHVY